MSQEQSQEKNLSNTELNSDGYGIDSVLKDLENISPWELSDWDANLIGWTEDQSFGQTEFQNKYYVVNSQVTPYRQLRQAVMEIQTRYNAIQKITIQYKRCLNDIARIKHEMELEEDPFYKQDKAYEIELLHTDRVIWANKIEQSKQEIKGLLKITKEMIGDNTSVDDIAKALTDYDTINEEEHKYWIARMAKQSAVDLLTTGRIQAGNLETMLQMAPEDQAAVTDLALTFSTAVNRSIGGIKELAEARVEKMLQGKPPQMFDTSGLAGENSNMASPRNKFLPR